MVNKIDVFIIDDDANNMQYFQTIIKRDDNIRCIGSTSSGNSAISIIKTVRPDIVLIDYALYPISGFDLLDLLRVEIPNLPIILLGGRATLQEKAEDAGASAYLPTPITPRNLIDTIIKVAEQE
ncbi:MAG: hypothetical protein Crog4KO_35270 [Crocinitomicaceae bacterium]